ncbi:adenylate/guanylate cyclase domain-containing protein [Marimonas sp. MJW-29]|uniref:Adenylate/guanylate cyclase domain-containing protein n=1 Tax=Sulfitobacter sediminis TaxID=3234186 RepID=A0ABV3RPH6_9RHOB
MAAPTLGKFEMTAALSDLTGWLIQQGLENTPIDAWLEQMCHRINDAGIPITRVNLSTRAHHPEIGAVAFRWHRDQESEQFEYRRSVDSNDVVEEYRRSPLYHLMMSHSSELRQRLDVPDPELDFPIFEELRERGATDYYAAKRFFLHKNQDRPSDPFALEEGMTISMVTDVPGGFTEAQLDGLRALLAPISLTLKSGANRKMAEDITAAYLGTDASRRVLSGDIMRGSSETISAVIWYFDLRGFTSLSETLGAEAIIGLLNDYFALAVDVVEEYGGNVLKFMGDGMLAIFDLKDVPEARLKAIEAACALREAFAEMNRTREKGGHPTTGFTLGLHAGDVLYGNIGGKTRLDFTVIGPAVNTTARILGMSGPVGQDIVISSAVARPLLDSRPDLVSLGAYRLRGVKDRQELFTLD